MLVPFAFAGKVHVKEPLDLAEKANKQISEAIEIAKQ